MSILSRKFISHPVAMLRSIGWREIRTDLRAHKLIFNLMNKAQIGLYKLYKACLSLLGAFCDEVWKPDVWRESPVLVDVAFLCKTNELYIYRLLTQPRSSKDRGCVIIVPCLLVLLTLYNKYIKDLSKLWMFVCGWVKIQLSTIKYVGECLGIKSV